MEWYDYDEADRIKHVYSKHTISEFWDWWSRGDKRVMEIRFKTAYSFVKEVSEKLYLPRGNPGVYVNTAEKLTKVISMVRDKTPVWFGVNPRKKHYNKFGGISFGGRDANISEISYLFFDIDRTEKGGEATSYELKNAYTLAKRLLGQFGKFGWDKSYCIICSGNGVQLVIKLDIPIGLPNLNYVKDSDTFEYNEEFEKLKNVIKEGIGKQAIAFSNKFEKELKVNIDPVALNIGRVAALPVTKNFKYDGFTWRGIIDMEDGVNDGLSDYILSYKADVKTFKEHKIFKEYDFQGVDFELTPFTPGKLGEHEIFFYLQNDFKWGAAGDVNNTLWFGIKGLMILDGWYDKKSRKVTQDLYAESEAVHKKCCAIAGRAFPMNSEPYMWTLKRRDYKEKINTAYYINQQHELRFSALLNHDVKMFKRAWTFPSREEIKYVRKQFELKEKRNFENIIKEGKMFIDIFQGRHDEPKWTESGKLQESMLNSLRQNKAIDHMKAFASSYLKTYGEKDYDWMRTNRIFYKAFNYSQKFEAIKRNKKPS